jgi:TnpA family transposase
MLAAALQDYGRLVKTEFVLRYLTRPAERRGIHRQLNKGESINALEDAFFYGNEGRIRLQTLDRRAPRPPPWRSSPPRSSPGTPTT